MSVCWHSEKSEMCFAIFKIFYVDLSEKCSPALEDGTRARCDTAQHEWLHPDPALCKCRECRTAGCRCGACYFTAFPDISGILYLTLYSSVSSTIFRWTTPPSCQPVVQTLCLTALVWAVLCSYTPTILASLLWCRSGLVFYQAGLHSLSGISSTGARNFMFPGWSPWPVALLMRGLWCKLYIFLPSSAKV